MVLNRDKLDILMEEVERCATLAYEMQCECVRDYKKDGSVITKADTTISKRIMVMISKLFPTCNRISEEESSYFNEDAPFTFILDPIDGTDVYSQGLPLYTVALGILDSKNLPVGAMIVAPRFGIARERLSLRLDPGEKLILDGKGFNLPQEVNKDYPTQITVSSSTQKHLNFSLYKGKIRTFGSTILHLICPVISPFIQGCINQKAYVWDIAASHAVLKAMGMDCVYFDGTPLCYTNEMLVERKRCQGTIYCGNEACRDTMRALLPLKEE